MRRRITALLGAQVSLAALVVLHSVTGGGPLLYDGLCGTVNYPLLGSHPGPSSVSVSYSASDLAGTQEVHTAPDLAPPAQLILGAGTLSVAAGATSVTITITPVRPPSIKPDGAIDGNVYDFEATSGGKAAPVAADHPVTIALEATSSGQDLTMEHLDGGRWVPLKTFQSGCGSTFDAAAPSLGMFALVARGSSSNGGAGSASSGPPALLIVVAVLVLLVLGVVLVRVRRSRSRAPRRRR